MDILVNGSARSIETIPTQTREGLRLLLQAYTYADDLDRDAWDFALEIDALRESGLTNSDLRWLLCADLVKHGRDLAAPGDEQRFFHPDQGLVLSDRTCFVLTENGVGVAHAVAASVAADGQEDGRSVPIVGLNGTAAAHRTDRIEMPKWDGERHQLFFGRFLVKEFKVHSPNQEAILTTFEEEGWPPRIDDPLWPRPDVDQRERLRNTIKSLNRHQVMQLIRFMGDGTGEAVRWEAVAEGRDTRSPRPR